MKNIIKWIKTKFNIRSVVRRAVKQWYDEVADIEFEEKNELCVYGDKITKTYGYQKRELEKNLLKFKISFWETFI